MSTPLAEPNHRAALAQTFAKMSARLWLVFGGIALIVGGMLFGDIFAVFVLHQNGGAQGEALMAAAHAVAIKDTAGVGTAFVQLGILLEDRGTKVDTHVHMTDMGYLCLLLALLQPYVRLDAGHKRRLAQGFVGMGMLLPLGIFTIHYVGLAYSPFAVIGWASVLADASGLVAMILLSAEAWGVWRYFRASPAELAEPEIPDVATDSWSRRTLLSGGTVLVLLGFLYGSGYAALHLYEHEAREVTILQRLLDAATAGDSSAMAAQGSAFGMLAGEKAVQIATHAHFVEFGLLALMLSFVQGYVALPELWRRRMVRLLLLGGLILPVAVSLELRYGMLAGAIADLGGLLVIVGLVGMLMGVRRYSGAADAEVKPATDTGDSRSRPTMEPSPDRKWLILGGLTLAAAGMLYGVHYAVFVEHQTLAGMGGALFNSFQQAACGNTVASAAALNAYGADKYVYVRQVDVHSHAAGLAMILIVLGIAFDRVRLGARLKYWLALAMLAGSVAFPLGIYLQSVGSADLGKMLAIVGSAMVVGGMVVVAAGFAGVGQSTIGQEN